MELLLSLSSEALSIDVLLCTLLAIISLSNSSVSAEYGECRTSLNFWIYCMAMRNVVIFVNFSLLAVVGVSQLIDAGTQSRRFSNAVLISRIRVRSRALAVFRRYLLNGAALGFFFSLAERLDYVVVAGAVTAATAAS